MNNHTNNCYSAALQLCHLCTVITHCCDNRTAYKPFQISLILHQHHSTVKKLSKYTLHHNSINRFWYHNQ